MSSRSRSHTALLIAVATSGLAACATGLASEAPAVCDGRHRQPANPHGSVLLQTLPPESSAPHAPPVPSPQGGDLDQPSSETGDGGCT